MWYVSWFGAQKGWFGVYVGFFEGSSSNPGQEGGRDKEHIFWNISKN